MPLFDNKLSNEFQKVLNQLEKEIEKVLNIIGNKLKKDAVKRLREGNKIAYRNLTNSIAYEIIKKDSFHWQLKFGSNSLYAKYVEEGREAGKFPPIEPLKKWAEKKRKKNSSFFKDVPIKVVPFMVRNKLKREGTKPYPFISWSINKNLAFIKQMLNEVLKIG